MSFIKGVLSLKQMIDKATKIKGKALTKTEKKTVTDKYWLAALIPDQNKSFKAIYTYDNGYIAYYRSLNATKVAAGGDHIVELSLIHI